MLRLRTQGIGVISCPKKVLVIGENVNSMLSLFSCSYTEACIVAQCAQMCPEDCIEVWRLVRRSNMAERIYERLRSDCRGSCKIVGCRFLLLSNHTTERNS